MQKRTPASSRTSMYAIFFLLTATVSPLAAQQAADVQSDASSPPLTAEQEREVLAKKRQELEAARKRQLQKLEDAERELRKIKWEKVSQKEEKQAFDSWKARSQAVTELKEKLVVLKKKIKKRQQQMLNISPPLGQSFTDPTTGMEFVYIPGGCFQMGNPLSERNKHTISPVRSVKMACVTGFYLGKYEVTNGQYRKYPNRSSHDSGEFKGESLNGKNQPAVNVSWNDAQQYAFWLSKKSGMRYRLPTEAEWEYAARGPAARNKKESSPARFWGEDVDAACRYANVADQTAKKRWRDWAVHNCSDNYLVAAPVGSFTANSYGLYDMLGNVWEWCQESWHDYYDGGPKDCSTWERFPPMRGGCWSGRPKDVRVTTRYFNTSDFINGNLGFRLVLPVYSISWQRKGVEPDASPPPLKEKFELEVLVAEEQELKGGEDERQQELEDAARRLQQVQAKVAKEKQAKEQALALQRKGMQMVDALFAEYTQLTEELGRLKEKEERRELQQPDSRSPQEKTFTDPTTGMEFVYIPGGCFQMGSPSSEKERFDDEAPVHEVCVNSFYLGKYEVTNAQYRRYPKESSHDSGEFEGESLNGGNQPVTRVNWYDAQRYISWLSQESGKGYRLPTEAEWEYAARGPAARNKKESSPSRFWGENADDACRYANVADQMTTNKWKWGQDHNCNDRYLVTAPVGSFAANRYGLHDMLGNVWEWCEDIYHDHCNDGSDDSMGWWNPTGWNRILLGGSWFDPPKWVRAASRLKSISFNTSGRYGFRLVLPVYSRQEAGFEPGTSSPPLSEKEEAKRVAEKPQELAGAERDVLQKKAGVAGNEQALAAKETRLQDVEGGLSECTQSTGELAGLKKRQERQKEEPQPESVPPLGQSFTDPTTGMEFVYIPGGCFQMGSPSSEKGRDNDEGPVHEVCVNGFYLGKYEVTNAQYRRYPKESSHYSGEFEGESLNGDNQPVVQVSLDDVEEYISWLSRKSDMRYRLPTEAEWEYAARGRAARNQKESSPSRFWGDSGETACRYASVSDPSAKKLFHWRWDVFDCEDNSPVTAPVGSFAANSYGLHDMLGNVWEWCGNLWYYTYEGVPDARSAWRSGAGLFLVIRGGSWYDHPRYVRAAYRNVVKPDYAGNSLGFRLVLGDYRPFLRERRKRDQ